MKHREIFDRYESILMLIVGFVCIIYQEHIYKAFPIIFGIFLLERGIHGCYEGYHNKDHLKKDNYKIEQSILVIIVSLGIMIRQHEALIVAAMFWGLAGLLKSSKFLKKLIYNISNHHKGNILLMIEFIIELSLSLILIFEPINNVEHHILILGIQLIMEGIFTLFNKLQQSIAI